VTQALAVDSLASRSNGRLIGKEVVIYLKDQLEVLQERVFLSNCLGFGQFIADRSVHLLYFWNHFCAGFNLWDSPLAELHLTWILENENERLLEIEETIRSDVWTGKMGTKRHECC